MICWIACKTPSYQALPPPTFDAKDGDQACYYRNTFDVKARRSRFPFNKAAAIYVVSFDSKWGKTPIENRRLETTKIKESICLNVEQTDSLSALLYNLDYSPQTHLFEQAEAGCYFPRHAIVFMDKRNRSLGYIELCFSCHRMRTDLPLESTGNFCTGKYEALKAYFSHLGIRYFVE